MTKPKAEAAEVRPVGRPSKYDPALCESVEAKLAEGFSLDAVAGSIGVARSSIYEWAGAHPEFSDAVKRGQAKSALWWEERLQRIAMSGAETGQATAVIFGLKNRAPGAWRDVVEQKVTLTDERAEELGDDELARIASGGRERTSPKALGAPRPDRVH